MGSLLLFAIVEIVMQYIENKIIRKLKPYINIMEKTVQF